MQQKTSKNFRLLTIPMFCVSFARENGQMNTLQDIQDFSPLLVDAIIHDSFDHCRYKFTTIRQSMGQWEHEAGVFVVIHQNSVH